MRQDISEFKMDIRRDTAELKVEMATMRADINKSLFRLTLAMAGLIVSSNSVILAGIIGLY